MNQAELVLIKNQAENDFIKSKVADGQTVWLRINDSKEQSKWVVDRRGYE